MADWFKFYETELDEPLFQFAIQRLPQVLPVWVGVLTECCHNKSGTITWNDDEANLFGFYHRLNVNPPIVNEALNLLVRIKYIEISNGTLKVLKWNEKQSEYCQWKGRKSKKKSRESRQVSRECPESVRLEERRGEEIRVDKREGGKPPNPLLPLISEIHDFWNTQEGLPKCLLVSDARRRTLETRFGEPFFSANWKSAIVKAQQSNFCRGNNDTGWRASFDWFIKPDSCQKIMEGKYDNRNGTGPIRPNPRNEGVIIGPTQYGTVKPRAQRELEEKRRLAGQVDAHANNPPAVGASPP